MKEYLIGTGGWAYFQVPGLHPLVAYSKAFNFVEVNSTFYKVPPERQVEKWRRIVPQDFQFTVRAHRTITHKHKLKPTEEALEKLETIQKICQILRAEIIHLQTPPTLKMGQDSIRNLQDLLPSTNHRRTRIALEMRGTKPANLPSELTRVMREHNVIHSTDLSKDEMPAYPSDILYSRLFGKGYHNVYQPTDEELKGIDSGASSAGSDKVVLSFHFVRMYKDAARFKIYKETGRFPSTTSLTQFYPSQDSGLF